MCEGLYRQNQAVRRMFGPSARITGSAGSCRKPGVLEIRVDGRTIGSGSSFVQALHDASGTMGASARATARTDRNPPGR
jgi:hypothetical protein